MNITYGINICIFTLDDDTMCETDCDKTEPIQPLDSQETEATGRLCHFYK